MSGCICSRSIFPTTNPITSSTSPTTRYATARCLQDFELRRQDEVYLNALGTTRIPDPDHGRRFLPTLPGRRMSIRCSGRLQRRAQERLGSVNRRRSSSQARIDVDGTMVETDRRMQRGHGHLLQRHLGLSSAGGLAGQHRRSVQHRSTAPAIVPRTKARPARSTNASRCAWKRAFARSSCAATPTSRRRRIWIAGTSRRA